MRKGFAVLLGTAAALLALTATQVLAQYPAPAGSLLLGTGDTTPGLGQSVPVTATVVDENGAPIGGVACTFSVADQPGSDASVQAGPFTTNDDGAASSSLNTGSTPGTIVVSAVCGDLAAQVSVVAGGSGGAALPPASLPETGQGANDGFSTNWAVWVLLGAGLLIGTSGLGYAWRKIK